MASASLSMTSTPRGRPGPTRADCLALDAADPLAPLRERFALPACCAMNGAKG